MPLTPVEVAISSSSEACSGTARAAVHRMMDDIADSFEAVWRERSQLVERVEELETEVTRHVELEGLLRSTLVSAERASQDLKETARREADVIVTEANAEARKVLRDAITEKEQVIGDVRRVQALLRSALAVVDEAPASGEHASGPGDRPDSRGPARPRLDGAQRGSRTRPPSRSRRPPRTDGDAEASRVGASILGGWSPARPGFAFASHPAPAARP